MSQWRIWLGLILVMLILPGCSAATTVPTATSVPATPTTVMPTPTVEQSAPATPTVAILPTEVAEVDYCIECHSDKEQLISNAKIEEEAPEENEGAG